MTLALAAGVALGVLGEESTTRRITRASFFASAFSYLTVSLYDFWEHFRLEKLATGRYLSWVVVPWGETLNHVATGVTIILFFVLARPLRDPLALRDYLALAAPLAFLALGWRDELVYHRRRSAHREDLMHTVAHLAAGVMLTTFVLYRMVPAIK
jgi:hypothetical protein